jgi:hypothetical protein
MQPRVDCNQLLEQHYPPFLAQLGTPNQDEGIAEFGRCAMYWLERNPTSCMRRSPREVRQDVISGVILHLIENNAARLRAYEDKGRPFFAWLITIADNRCKTLRGKRNREDSLDDLDPDGKPVREPASPEPDYSAEIQVDIIWKYAQQLDTDCLLGLIGQYLDGWDPKDFMFLLGRTGPKANVKTSARISYCRDVLNKLILRAGFRREDFLD